MKWGISLALLLVPAISHSLQLPAPTGKTGIIGENFQVTARKGDNFMKLARLYSAGFHELAEANNGTDPWKIPEGKTLNIPTRYILPNAPRQGIIVNIAELRLYYYKGNKVYTYPVGIGRHDWMTPLGKKVISHKHYKPSWHVPKAIQASMAKKGINLPNVVPSGPKNPLGDYVLRLSHSSYLIHSTNNPLGISRRTTSGCVSMFPEDIKSLFHMVSTETPVRIVNQYYKLGADQKFLYLEVHQPLKEFSQTTKNNPHEIIQTILRHNQQQAYQLDWDAIHSAVKSKTGVPVVIGYQKI